MSGLIGEVAGKLAAPLSVFRTQYVAGKYSKKLAASEVSSYRLPLEDLPEGYIPRVQIGQPKDVRRVPKSQVATFNTPTAAEETIAYNLRVQEAVKRRDWHKFKGIDMGLRHDDIFYNEMDDEIVTEALKRCDPDERNQRIWRNVQATMHSYRRTIMPAEQNYTPENDVHYLMPWVEQVDAEFQEAEYWDSY